MKFRYSIELPISENPTDGLAGNLPLRCHQNSLKEDTGAIRAQFDWSRLVGPIDDFKGGLSAKYGLMQVAVPECRPERLEIIAYASELGFLYDDNTEHFDGDQLGHANDSMQSAFAEGLKNGNIGADAGGLKAMQSILLKEMIAIDKPRAVTAMRVWIEFLQKAAGRCHDEEHVSFESYLQYRVLDVGEMFWFGLVTFGMALTVPDNEIPLMRELTKPCWVVLALQNDICSYQKEVQAASLSNASHIVNALWVLMRHEKLTFDTALATCRRQIHRSIVEFQENIDKCRDNKALSKDTKVYMESLLYTISGDAAWSLVTPRYNVHQSCSALQVRMKEEMFEKGGLATQPLEREYQTRTVLNEALQPSEVLQVQHNLAI